MTKRIVIHIGTHKTGTTSIQEALFNARPELAAKGVLYPSTDFDRQVRERNQKQKEIFVVSVRGTDEEVAKERAALVAEFESSGAQTMVLSEEGFSDPNPKLAEFFRPLAGQYALEVVCYVRRQDIFAEAFFNQEGKLPHNNRTESIVEFVRRPGIKRHLDYATTLGRWKEFASKMTVLNYATAVKSPGLLPSFIAAAGLPAVALNDTYLNASSDMRLVLILLEMKRRGIPYEMNRMLNAGERIKQEFEVKTEKLALGSRLRRALLDEYRECNAKLESEYGVVFDSNMPEEREHPLLDCDPTYVNYLLSVLSRPVRKPA